MVPPKEMLLLFSIATFLTNYEVIVRKLYMVVIHSIVRKQTIFEQNNSFGLLEGWVGDGCKVVLKLAYSTGGHTFCVEGRKTASNNLEGKKICPKKLGGQSEPHKNTS